MKLSALQAGFNLDHIALESPTPNELSKFYKNFIMMEHVEKKNQEIICEGQNRKVILIKGKNYITGVFTYRLINLLNQFNMELIDDYSNILTNKYWDDINLIAKQTMKYISN